MLWINLYFLWPKVVKVLDLVLSSTAFGIFYGTLSSERQQHGTHVANAHSKSVDHTINLHVRFDSVKLI